MEQINKKTVVKGSIIFTLSYLAVFSIISITKQDYTFLFSAGLMILLMLVGLRLDKKFNFPRLIIIGATVLAALHIFASYIHIDGVKLYDLWLIEGHLKFDNIIHFVASFVAIGFIYSLISPYLNEKIKHKKLLLASILILAAMGAGTINEIVELNAVLFLGMQNTIGDYLNNAFDLVFNFFGAFAACLLVLYYKNKKQQKPLKISNDL